MTALSMRFRHKRSYAQLGARLRELAGSADSVRVLIADDHCLFAEALMTTLSADERLEVVGHAGDGYEAIDLAGSLSPDVILMDLDMPLLDGIQATRGVLAAAPDARVVILTADDSGGPAVHARAAGASGYVTKDCSANELLDAIFEVAPRVASPVLQPA